MGLSATGGLPTVLGNYDLRYLREQLGDRFKVLSADTQEKIRREMENLWTPYRDGRVQVDLTVVDRQALPWQQRLQEIFGAGADARLYEQRFIMMGLPEYQSQRYCNLFAAIKAFWLHREIRAFLCLNQLLPAPGKRDLDEKLLRDALETLRVLFAPEEQGKLVVLRSGEHFDEAKGALMQGLAAGERAVHLLQLSDPRCRAESAIPRGQAHRSPLPEGRCRSIRQPYDPQGCGRLYLGDITHVTVNLQEADHWQGTDLMRYCFQMECLYQNDEISRRTMQTLLKNGIGHFSGKREIDAAAQAQLKRCPSFSGRVTRDVVQAVDGWAAPFSSNRLCTSLPQRRCCRISTLTACIDGFSPRDGDTGPCRTCATGSGPSADRRHLEAERIATCGNAYLMRMLSASWTAESIALWKQLRQTVLCHPRADETLHGTDPVIRSYYLPISPAQPGYFYAQKGDFFRGAAGPQCQQGRFCSSFTQRALFR